MIRVLGHQRLTRVFGSRTLVGWRQCEGERPCEE